MELQKREIKGLLIGVAKEVDGIMLATQFNEYYVKHSELTVRMKELIKSTGELVDYELEAPFSLTNFALFAGISPYRLNKLILTTNEDDSPELYEVLSSIVEIIKNENIQGAMLGKYKESTVQKVHRLAEIVENNGKGNVQAINIDFGCGIIDLTE